MRNIKLGEAFYLSLPLLNDQATDGPGKEGGKGTTTSNPSPNKSVVEKPAEEGGRERLTRRSSRSSNKDQNKRAVVRYFQVVGELQLVWKDKNHEGQELVSVKLYLRPEDTPTGRLSSHGEVGGRVD